MLNGRTQLELSQKNQPGRLLMLNGRSQLKLELSEKKAAGTSFKLIVFRTDEENSQHQEHKKNQQPGRLLMLIIVILRCLFPLKNG